MKTIIAVSIFFFSSLLLAGGSGGGGGVRPGMGMFRVPGNEVIIHEFVAEDRQGGGGLLPIHTDLVKTLGIDELGKVHFQYMGFDSSKVEMHAIDVNDLEQNYLDALKKSQQSENWESVTVEGLGN